MVRSVAGDLPEQVKNNQSVNTAARNGGQKMSQYSWFTVYHLTAAKMYLDRLTYEDSEDLLCRDPKQQNDFYIGNLLPDTVTSREAKAVSHFRDPAYKECMMEWPHPDRFIEKYSDRMGEAVYRGYLFHLYIDRCFFRDYIPEVAGFYDVHGKETGIRDEIAEVCLKKSGACVPLKSYMSEEYYYGDYTKMNTRLCRQFSLPAELKAGADPGIEEADYSGIGRILDELERFRQVPESAVEDLKVFDLDGLIGFLQNVVLDF